MKEKTAKTATNRGRRTSNSNKFSSKAPNIKASYSSEEHTKNDWRWYAKNAQILKDVASIPFNDIVGTSLDQLVSGSKLILSPNLRTMPGIMTIDTLLVPGVASQPTDAVNVAAQSIYSYIRNTNSGATNYDPADIMMYILAMDQLYAMHNWLKRVYGEVMQYSLINRYIPNALVEAEGFDFKNIVANLSNFRYFINELGLQIASRAVPDNMDYLVKHSWMFSNVFKDGESDKAQYYMYRPAGFYIFNEVSGTAGKLVFKQLPAGNLSYATITTYVEQFISAIMGSQDFGTMSGDIIKAYGTNRLFKVEQIDENYATVPTKSAEAQMQIHNATIFPHLSLANYTGLDITQDPSINSGAVVFQPRFTITAKGCGAGWEAGRILDTYIQSPTPEDVIEMVTGVAFASNYSADLYSYQVDVCGSTLYVGMNIYKFRIEDETGDMSLVNYPYCTFMNCGGTEVSYGYFSHMETGYTIAHLESMLAKFDWHPIIYIIRDTYDGGVDHAPINIMGFSGDVDVYTIVDKWIVQKMHKVALLSLFDIPMSLTRG
nr:putative capsid [Marmot picobirnavirus]